MGEARNRRPSEWRRLFAIAIDLVNQLENKAGPIGWSFGGGTAMMIQIGHRESHDIDIFLDDPQLLGFIDPSKTQLSFITAPSDYLGDGMRFQKFAFENVGEVDFVVAGPLTKRPFETRTIEGRETRLETVAEIIAKKVYYRGLETRPRDIFDIAAAARTERVNVIEGLRAFPRRVAAARERLDKLNPKFVELTIAQLMIMPGFEATAINSLADAKSLLADAMS